MSSQDPQLDEAPAHPDPPPDPPAQDPTADTPQEQAESAAQDQASGTEPGTPMLGPEPPPGIDTPSWEHPDQTLPGGTANPPETDLDPHRAHPEIDHAHGGTAQIPGVPPGPTVG